MSEIKQLILPGFEYLFQEEIFMPCSIWPIIEEESMLLYQQYYKTQRYWYYYSTPVPAAPSPIAPPGWMYELHEVPYYDTRFANKERREQIKKLSRRRANDSFR